MHNKVFWICFCCLLICRDIALSQQKQLPFSSVPETTKQYVICKMAKDMRLCFIVLVKRELCCATSSSDLSFPQAFTLGLEPFKMLSCFKAARGRLLNNDVDVIYVSEENISLQPIMHDRSGAEYIVENGRQKKLNGNERWQFAPPYLPRLQNLPQQAIVLLMLGCLEKIDVGTLREPRSFWEDDPMRPLFDDASRLNLDDLMKKNDINLSITNRLFKVNTGNVFIVENVDIKSISSISSNQTGAIGKKSWQNPLAESYYLTFTSREVSEIVYLAYQLDGPSGTEGYAAACGRYPELLLPIQEIKTELGRRLRDALADQLPAAQGGKVP